MRAPKSIRTAEEQNPEIKAISEKALNALYDKDLSDEEANKIIDDCNARLTSLGMPSGGHIIHR